MVAAIIQARMGSTRFPGKSIRLLNGLPILEHIIIRLKQVPEIDQIPLNKLTSTRKKATFYDVRQNVRQDVRHGSTIIYNVRQNVRR